MADNSTGYASQGDPARVDVVQMLGPGKLALAAAPGVLDTNCGLYKTHYQASVHALEATRLEGQDFQDLSPKSFGQTATVTLTREDFNDGCFLSLILPTSGIPSGTYFAEGWGFRCIKTIKVTLGNTSASNQEWTGYQLYQQMLQTCNSWENKQDFTSMFGGQEIMLNSGALMSSLTVQQRQAFLPLPLPWVSMDLKNKVPMDMKGMVGIVTITIEFNPLAANSSGTGGPAGGSGAATITATDFAQARVISAKLKLSNPTAALSAVMDQEPVSFLAYSQPYVQPAVITGAPANTLAISAGTVINVQMQNFINADINAILFSVVRTTDFLLNGPCQPLACIEVSDIQLNHGGQPLLRYDGYLYRQMYSRASKTFDPVQYIQRRTDSFGSGGGVLTSGGSKSLHYNLELGQCDYLKNVYEAPNVKKYDAQQLQLLFTVPEAVSGGITIVGTYVYTRTWQMSVANGVQQFL